MMYLSIDRIEDGFAICEDDNGNATKIKLELLPYGVCETDVIGVDDEGNYSVDKKETNKRRNLLIKLDKYLGN